MLHINVFHIFSPPFPSPNTSGQTTPDIATTSGGPNYSLFGSNSQSNIPSQPTGSRLPQYGGQSGFVHGAVGAACPSTVTNPTPQPWSKGDDVDKSETASTLFQQPPTSASVPSSKLPSAVKERKQQQADVSTGMSIPLPPEYDPTKPPPNFPGLTMTKVPKVNVSTNVEPTTTKESLEPSTSGASEADVKARAIKGGSQQSLSSVGSTGSQQSVHSKEELQKDEDAQKKADKEFIRLMKHRSRSRKGKNNQQTSTSSVDSSGTGSQASLQSVAAGSSVSLDSAVKQQMDSNRSLNIGSTQSLETTSTPTSMTSVKSSSIKSVASGGARLKVKLPSLKSLQSAQSKKSVTSASTSSVASRKQKDASATSSDNRSSGGR